MKVGYQWEDEGSAVIPYFFIFFTTAGWLIPNTAAVFRVLPVLRYASAIA